MTTIRQLTDHFNALRHNRTSVSHHASMLYRGVFILHVILNQQQKQPKNLEGIQMIHVTELKKTFGAEHALKGIDFEVAKGEVFGLLGPSGSGKTRSEERRVGKEWRYQGERTENEE